MNYQPTLESVKVHPLPDWYDDAKFGIFIHWGLYSVPAFAPKGEIDIEKLLKGEITNEETPYSEWYQNSLRIEGSSVQKYHLENYGDDFRYEQFSTQFNQQIQNWDPERWADLFSRAGARYVVLVSKHHDGFLMWNSNHPNPRLPDWQAVRDIAGELTEAVRAKGLKMGFYYSSLLDWSFTQQPIRTVADLIAGSETSQAYADYVEQHWLELIEKYDPWILWGDIGYPPGYKLPKLFAHFYNRKPDGVVNDRWVQLPKFMFSKPGRWLLLQALKRMRMGGTPQVPHCDFVTPEYAALDHIAEHKWETCRGMGNSFGYNQFEDGNDYKTADELIRLLVDIVSKNGNLLLNVGPCADGSLHPAQTAALEGIGAWLEVNGEAIYGTRPWERFKDHDDQSGEVRYTTKEGVLYASVFQFPQNGKLSLPLASVNSCSLLGVSRRLTFQQDGDNIVIDLTEDASEEIVPVIKIEKDNL
jgi:alpha-L-fucosidase